MASLFLPAALTCAAAQRPLVVVCEDLHWADAGTLAATSFLLRAIDTEGSWSPDGRYIYFPSDRSGGPQVFRVPAARGTPERVTSERSYKARPRLSPSALFTAMMSARSWKLA